MQVFTGLLTLFLLVPVLFVGVIALCVLSAAVGQTLSGVLSRRDQSRMKCLFRETAVEGSLQPPTTWWQGSQPWTRRGGQNGDLVWKSMTHTHLSVGISDQ